MEQLPAYIEVAVTVFFGIAALFGAIVLLVQKNPVRAALGLLLSMASIGVLYLSLGASTVGWMQLFIYAGAIVILFLFAVMNFPVAKHRRDRIPVVSILGLGLVIVLASVLIGNIITLARVGVFSTGIAPRLSKDINEIGARFMDDWIYPFELTSVLLLVAIIGFIHITRPLRHFDEEGEA